MRASTITDVSLLNRGARIAAIALTTAIGSLAVTAGASGGSGYTSVDAIMAASDSPAEPAGQLPAPDAYLARLGSEGETVGTVPTPDTYLAQLGSRGNNTEALASATSEPTPSQSAAVAGARSQTRATASIGSAQRLARWRRSPWSGSAARRSSCPAGGLPSRRPRRRPAEDKFAL